MVTNPSGADTATHDLDDWLQAERDLRGRRPSVRRRLMAIVVGGG
jgi:hypothetical protein